MYSFIISSNPVGTTPNELGIKYIIIHSDDQKVQYKYFIKFMVNGNASVSQSE